jgi:hypothetical protein
VTWWAKKRSATAVSSTRPPAIVAWTSEIGASASAPTWKPQPAIATTIPSVYQRERKSISELQTGRRHSTLGRSTAPRCL